MSDDSDEFKNEEPDHSVNRRRFIKGLSAAGSAAVAGSAFVGGAAAKSTTRLKKASSSKAEKYQQEALQDLKASSMGDVLVKSGYGVSMTEATPSIKTEQGQSVGIITMPLTLTAESGSLVGGTVINDSTKGEVARYVWKESGEQYAVRNAPVSKLAPNLSVNFSNIPSDAAGIEVFRPEQHFITASFSQDSTYKDVSVQLPDGTVSVDREAEPNGTVTTASYCPSSPLGIFNTVGGCAVSCGACATVEVGDWVGLLGCLLCGGCTCGVACCVGQAAPTAACIAFEGDYLANGDYLTGCAVDGCNGQLCS